MIIPFIWNVYLSINGKFFLFVLLVALFNSDKDCNVEPVMSLLIERNCQRLEDMAP